MPKEPKFKIEVLKVIEDAGKPLSVRDVAEEMDHDIASVRTFMYELEKDGKLEYAGKNIQRWKLYKLPNQLTNGSHELFIEAMETFLPFFQANKSNLNKDPIIMKKIGELVEKYKEVKTHD